MQDKKGDRKMVLEDRIRFLRVATENLADDNDELYDDLCAEQAGCMAEWVKLTGLREDQFPWAAAKINAMEVKQLI